MLKPQQQNALAFSLKFTTASCWSRSVFRDESFARRRVTIAFDVFEEQKAGETGALESAEILTAINRS